MLQPFNPAENILLVHKTMVQEEFQRNDPAGHRFYRDVPSSRNMLRVRQLFGGALIFIGERLAQTDRVAGQATAPAAVPDRVM